MRQVFLMNIFGDQNCKRNIWTGQLADRYHWRQNVCSKIHGEKQPSQSVPKLENMYLERMDDNSSCCFEYHKITGTHEYEVWDKCLGRDHHHFLGDNGLFRGRVFLSVD